MKKITYIPPVATVHATTEIISILANTKYRQTTENVEDVEDVEDVELGSNHTDLWEED